MFHNRSLGKGAGAVTRAVCETLEARWLLATYEVPAGHTAAYLTNGQFPGQVLIHLDDPMADPVFPNPFSATTGQHVLNAGTNGTTQNPFLVVDRVWARWKPQAQSGNPEGIKVIASEGIATLRIESNNVTDEFWDRQYTAHPSTSTDTRIEALNWDTGETGETHIGAGVSNVIIRTNDVQASEHYSNNLPLPTNPGTRVHVRELAAGIHLTVDTGQGTWDQVVVGGGIDQLSIGVVAEEVRVITGAGHAIVAARGTQDGVNKARVDFGDGSGLGDNFLDVQEFSTVTLAEDVDSASHTVVVEDVDVNSGNISKPAMLIVEDQSIIDDLNVEGVGASGLFKDTDRQVGNDTFVTEVGNLTIVNDGVVTLQARSESPTSGAARKLIINNLNLGTPGSPSGTLDLMDNLLIIDYSGASPIADIDDLITAGYANGAWTGTGIQSTKAAGTVNDQYKTAVGFAENVTGASDGLDLSAFEGQTVDDTTVLVKYTWYGDANLSGEVGLPDFNRLAGNFGQSPRRWVHGDFTFDNTVNLADFNRLAANFGQGGLGPGEGEYQGWDMSWEELMKLWQELTS